MDLDWQNLLENLWQSPLGPLFVGLVFGLLPLAGFSYLLYFLLGLPLRRQERARFFLDLVELTLKEGRSVEQSIVSLSHSRDASVGVKFHLLAAYLENGLPLGAALERTRGFLPPALAAMLKAGGETGQLARVIPACRVMLKDGVARVFSAQHYLALLVFWTPAMFALLRMLSVFVWPKFREILKDMAPGATLNPALAWVPDNALVATLALGLPLLFYVAALLYIGGPRLAGWLRVGLPGLSDALFWFLPWQRRRQQRDFSALLAVLLDAGLPEDKAVTFAAECAANAIFERRAARVVDGLRRGEKLTEAVRHLDDAGEFRWRLANAAHGGGGFLAALRGWHEALDAQAFQQEQTAAQVFTTGLVLFNGLIVGVTAVATFQMLITILLAVDP